MIWWLLVFAVLAFSLFVAEFESIFADLELNWKSVLFIELVSHYLAPFFIVIFMNVVSYNYLKYLVEF
jgi:hypothetical protein